jgi:hypothetical protein
MTDVIDAYHTALQIDLWVALSPLHSFKVEAILSTGVLVAEVWVLLSRACPQ